jgi:hypothetical protein
MDGRKCILIITTIGIGSIIISQLISSIFRYKLSAKALAADCEISRNKVKAAEKLTAISEGWYKHGYPKEGCYDDLGQQEGCSGEPGSRDDVSGWHNDSRFTTEAT